MKFSKYSLCPQARRTLGETPLHFPERYGKLVGVKNRPKGDEQEFMLTYEIDEVMTSLVTLQISADDIILIYNRLQKKIPHFDANSGSSPTDPNFTHQRRCFLIDSYNTRSQRH